MDEPLYMDALITPHRSLSERGFIVLIAIMTAINCATAVMFVSMGAAPVPAFLGLDLVAVVIAFAVSNRQALRKERVQVSAAEVRVMLETPKGEQLLWASPTAFTRVTVVGESEDLPELRLALSGRELPLALALGRAERLDFAKALRQAIAQARQERYA
ncbi:MAG TPA: DUF2244 domain-containing protein [Caulobacteraceae bacterium]